MTNRFVTEFDPAPADITICASMSHKDKWLKIADQLRDLGYTVATPDISEKDDWSTMTPQQIADQKGYLIRQHFAKISASRAILVCGGTKNGVKDYIGGNTFMEMTFAFAYDKPIFIYDDIPEMSYSDEIIALNPTVLQGDLDRLALD